MYEIDRDLFNIYPKPNVKLLDLPVTASIRDTLTRVVREYKQRANLRKHGLCNSSTIFLCGPSGTGKRLTTRAMATALKFSIYEARTSAITTGADLPQQICFNRGIFLFRGIVPAKLFKQLKLAAPYGMDSLIVVEASTIDDWNLNVLEQFDERIRYRYPTKDEIAHIVRKRFASWEVTNEMIEMVSLNSDNLSHMEIMRVCDSVLKAQIMKGDDSIDVDSLHTALKSYLDSKWWKRNEK